MHCFVSPAAQRPTAKGRRIAPVSVAEWAMPWSRLTQRVQRMQCNAATAGLTTHNDFGRGVSRRQALALPCL